MDIDVKKLKNEMIHFESECAIQAQQSEDGEEPKPPTFDMVAYNGGKMTVGSIGAVAIDLNGMKVAKKTPILYGHNSRELDSLLGQTAKIDKTEKLLASGNITGDNDVIRQVVTHAKNGFEFQASVGVDIVKAQEVPEEEEIEVNGQTLQGPLVLVAKSYLREISVVPLGADSETNTSIAAEIGNENTNNGRNTMAKNDGKTEEKLTAEQIREENLKAMQEENRILKVKDAAKDHPEIQAEAVEKGWTVEQTENAVLKADMKDMKAQKNAEKDNEDRPLNGDFSVNTGAKPNFDSKTIEASAAIRTGLNGIEKSYDSDTLNAADDLKVNSLTDLVAYAMALDGKKLECTRHETRDYLKAAFSTTELSNILSNLAGKYILEGFGGVEETWRKIANTKSVVDFKQVTGSRLVMSDLLQELGPGGEIKHASLSDETRTLQADTKALMLNITRQEIINDDLGALTDLPNRFGFAAARKLNTDFWADFETFVEGSDFSAAIGNEKASATPLSLDNLEAIEKLFLELTDSDGNYTGVDPRILLVSPTNGATARQIYKATTVNNGTTSDQPDANIYAGMFEVAVSRYLSAAPWYLCADPRALPSMTVGFLNGREEPFVESADADFNQLGMKMRCYFDYGIGEGNSKALVRAKA